MMSGPRFGFIGVNCLLTILLGACATVPKQDPAVSPTIHQGKEAIHSFKVVIASGGTFEVQGAKQGIDAHTELNYTWKCSGRKRVLRFDSIITETKMGDGKVESQSMDRERMKRTRQGEDQEMRFETAPPEVKRILLDSFENPLCEIDVDEYGREVSRVIVAGPGAKAFIDNDMIANAILFHPPFYCDRNEWQVDARMSTGNGGCVNGKLTYRRTLPEKGCTVVQVSGVLVNEGLKKPGSSTGLKSARYVVSGEQTYDSAQEEWVRGMLSIDVSYLLVSDDKTIGSSKCVMVLSFDELPEKK